MCGKKLLSEDSRYIQMGCHDDDCVFKLAGVLFFRFQQAGSVHEESDRYQHRQRSRCSRIHLSALPDSKTDCIVSDCGAWGNNFLYAMGGEDESFFCPDKDRAFYQRDRTDPADDPIGDLSDQ